MPDFSLTINGQPAKHGDTAHVGDVLVVTAQPGFYLKADLFGHQVDVASVNGVATLKLVKGSAPRVTYWINVGGGLGWTFGLDVVDAVAVPVVAQASASAPTPINNKRIVTAVNASGESWKHVPSGDWPYAVEVATGGSLAGPVMIATVPRADVTKPNPVAGILVTGKGSSVSDVILDDKSGWGINVRADSVTLSRITGSTFTDYLVYCEFAQNVTINGVHCIGGSTCESILRFAGASGTVSNVHIEYTTPSHKACIRGSFIGTINDAYCIGGVVGPNPLDGMDGGQALLFWKFKTAAGFVDAPAAKQPACIAAVHAAILAGETNQTKLGRIGATAGGVTVTDWELADTANFRATQLAERSEVVANRCSFLTGIRWNAGTKITMNGGKIGGDSDGNLFTGPGWKYPDTDYVLPGDIIRPAPAIVLNNVELDGTFNIDRALIVCNGCTGKGAA